MIKKLIYLEERQLCRLIAISETVLGSHKVNFLIRQMIDKEIDEYEIDLKNK